MPFLRISQYAYTTDIEKSEKMALLFSAINKNFFLKVPKPLKSLSLEFFKNLVDFEI